MKSYFIRLFFTGDKDIVKTETVKAENPFEAKDIIMKKYGTLHPRTKEHALEILSKIEILNYNIIN